jgi:hypothetical protein
MGVFEFDKNAYDKTILEAKSSYIQNYSSVKYTHPQAVIVTNPEYYEQQIEDLCKFKSDKK